MCSGLGSLLHHSPPIWICTLACLWDVDQSSQHGMVYCKGYNHLITRCLKMQSTVFCYQVMS